MTRHRTTERIAALERARAQIEIALGGDQDWRAMRQAAAGSGRLAHDRRLAGNPVYRCWELLNEAIDDLRQRELEPGTARDDLTRIRGIGPALAQRLAERGIASYGQIAAWRADDVRDVSEALGLGRKISRQNWIEQAALLELRQPPRKGRPGLPAAGPSGTGAAPPAGNARVATARAEGQSIELHNVLEHIRNDAALRGDPPSVPFDPEAKAPDSATVVEHASTAATAALAAGAQPAPEQRPPQASDSLHGREGVALEPEEATVTFVIREGAHTGSVDDRAEGSGAQAGRLSERWVAAGPEDSLYAPDDGQAEEAEVAIVSHPADRRSARGSGQA